jgi:hypothetical protein
MAATTAAATIEKRSKPMQSSATKNIIRPKSCMTPAARSVMVSRPAWIHEGALLFVTEICFTYRDDPYKRELGRENDRRPSSKPAGARGVRGREVHHAEEGAEERDRRHDRVLADVRHEVPLAAKKLLGWPKRYKLAHAFLWEYSCKRLKLAQLLGQLGVFLTFPGTYRKGITR